MKDHTTLKMHVFIEAYGLHPLEHHHCDNQPSAWVPDTAIGCSGSHNGNGSGSSVVGLSTNGCKQMELWAAQSSKCSQKGM